MEEKMQKPLTTQELETMFTWCMEDCYEAVDICGLKYTAIMALKKVDQIAWRELYHTWLDDQITDGLLRAEGDDIYDGIAELAGIAEG